MKPKTSTVVLSAILWSAVFVALVTAAGCVSYAKVEKTAADGKTCRAVVRGNFFSSTTPAALEECRSDEDR